LISIEAIIFLFNYWHEVDDQIEQLNTMHQTAIIKVLNRYEHMINAIYEERYHLPDIAALLKKANTTDKTKQAKLRNQLYHQFIRSFKNLEPKGIRTLQFILPDGRSFLRFDHPDQYGSHILNKRPILQQVLKGFPQNNLLENDPSCLCYYFAFPINDEQEIVGIIEFMVPFDTIRYSLANNAGFNTHHQLILWRDLFGPTSDLKPQKQIRSFSVNQGSSAEPAIDKDPQQSILSKIETQLSANPQVWQQLKQGNDYSTEICLQSNHCYVVSLNAIPNSHQHNVGYILSYTAMKTTRFLRSSHLTLFLLGALLILITLYLFHRWLQTTQRLRTITDHMAEGMYVIDISGKILYVNPTACLVLDYKKYQLLGQFAHDKFHCQPDGIPLASQNYELLHHTMQGEQYNSDGEHFKCRNGNIIRVSVVSSPFWNAHRLSGSVVLFRDITQDYEIKKRQQRSEVALSTLAEGVMVTNARGDIEAVNRAFSEITGYEEHEVLGKKPNILKSGHHDETFYTTLWSQLISKGRWEGEIWNRRKNGQIYPEFLRITSVTDKEGKVTDYVATFSDVTEKRQHEQQLQKLAYTDPLTQLHNRAAFVEMFERVLAHAERHGTRCALLYLDLDRFKKINDTLGHMFGDKLLIEIAKRLNQAVRVDDEVARLGGDEFIVLLEDIHQDNAPARVARKIVSLLGQPIQLDPHILHVTTSVGIAIYPQDGQDTNTLLKNADAAMYMAKREGRNGFHYFTEAMAKKEHNRFKLEIDLHTALLNDEFFLRYQPKINLYTYEMVGLEALLYWQHPMRGILSAGEFLSVAQDAGVTRDISNWVINESCDQMLAWLDQGFEPGRLGINIDSQTFNSNDAYDQICRTVELTGVSPHRVELEISESGLLDKPFDDPLWEQLVELGFTLSIDDFGMGESSLYRLKHLPVNTLKIDKSFIRDIESDEDDRSIIRTVISMGQSLSLNILAEGVENNNQLEFLKNVGCHEAQGYLFCKPKSAEAITDMLSNERIHSVG
jgi:diguanylate cyclase (GGDEF)-like protein/PAS domain S-box-containing protein